MLSVRTRPTRLAELNWLAEIHEFAPPLAPDSPIWMRETEISQDLAALRGEKHPCCEISFVLQGEGTAYIEGTEARFQAGDLLLIGPGVPHSAQIDRFPHRELAVLFLPALLLEMGPLGDGAALLRRLTMRQKIGQRLVRLPGEYRSRIENALGQMWMDFNGRRFGWEMRLRACLTEILVVVVQWEEGQSAAGPDEHAHEDWAKLEHSRHGRRQLSAGRSVERALPIGRDAPVPEQ